jgi:hypothetical protein
VNDLLFLISICLLWTGCWLLNKGHPEATTEALAGATLMYFAGVCTGCLCLETEDKK